MFTSALTYKTDSFFICIARKSTGISQQSADCFRRLHLIIHGAFYLTQYLNQCLVGINENHITVLQTDIIFQPTFHDKIIDIQIGNRLSIAYHLYTAKTADFIHSARPIQSMENGREWRKRISTRHGNLTHNVHLNGTDFTQCQFYLGIGSFPRNTSIYFSELTLQIIIGFLYGLSTQINRAQILDLHSTFRRDCFTNRILGSSPNVNDNLIACTQTIIARSRYIYIRFKSKILVIKDIMPENLLGRIDFHSVQVIIPGLFTAIQPHSITAALLAGFCPQTLNALFFRVELI